MKTPYEIKLVNELAPKVNAAGVCGLVEQNRRPMPAMSRGDWLWWIAHYLKCLGESRFFAEEQAQRVAESYGYDFEAEERRLDAMGVC